MKIQYQLKKLFCSELNLEGTSDADYDHVKKVWEAIEIKNFGEYHDLYVQCDTLLLADIFKHFRDKCIEIYGLDSGHVLTAPILAWQACLQKTKVELKLLTNIDMLLMVEKGIKSGICQVIHRYAKANNKYMKNYVKSIKLSFIEYLDANNLYGWAVSQKLAVNGLKWVKNLRQFNESFIRNYNENSNKG